MTGTGRSHRLRAAASQWLAAAALAAGVLAAASWWSGGGRLTAGGAAGHPAASKAGRPAATGAGGAAAGGDAVRSGGGGDATSGVEAMAPGRAAAVLWRAFAATGAEPATVELHDWSLLARGPRRPAQLAELAERLAAGLGVPRPRAALRPGAGGWTAEVAGTLPGGGEADVIAAMVAGRGAAGAGADGSGPVAGGGGPAIVVIRETLPAAGGQATGGGAGGGSAGHSAGTLAEAPGAGPESATARALARVWAVAAGAGGSPQLSACVEGSLSARLVGARQPYMIRRAFEAVHASRVEGVQSGVETSVSGYTPLAPMYILSNGRRMNLQVAVHFDRYHQRTDVLVGTPIILATY